MDDDRSGDRSVGGADDGGRGSSEPVQFGRTEQSSESKAGDDTTTDSSSSTADDRYCSHCGAVIADAAEICPECGVRSKPQGGGESGAGNPSGRYLSAFVGGVVSFVVGWIPVVGPAVGGAVAGYLRGSDTKESAISGLIANVLASIPMMGLAALFMILGGIGAASEGESDVALGLFLWAVIFVASFVYFFVLGAVGGALGAAVTNRRAP